MGNPPQEIPQHEDQSCRRATNDNLHKKILKHINSESPLEEIGEPPEGKLGCRTCRKFVLCYVDQGIEESIAKSIVCRDSYRLQELLRTLKESMDIPLEDDEVDTTTVISRSAHYKNKAVEKWYLFICCCGCYPILGFFQSLLLLLFGPILLIFPLLLMTWTGLIWRLTQWHLFHADLHVALRIVSIPLLLIYLTLGLIVVTCVDIGFAIGSSFLPVIWMIKYDSMFPLKHVLKWQLFEAIPKVKDFTWGAKGSLWANDKHPKLSKAILIIIGVPIVCLTQGVLMLVVTFVPYWISMLALVWTAIPLRFVQFYWIYGVFGWNLRIAFSLFWLIALIGAFPVALVATFLFAFLTTLFGPTHFFIVNKSPAAFIHTLKWQFGPAQKRFYDETWGETAHNRATRPHELRNPPLWRGVVFIPTAILGFLVWFFLLLFMFIIRIIPFFIAMLHGIWHNWVKRFKKDVVNSSDQRCGAAMRRLGWLILILPLTIASILSLIVFPLALILIPCTAIIFGFFHFPFMVLRGQFQRAYKKFYEIDGWVARRHFRRAKDCEHHHSFFKKPEEAFAN